MKTKYAGTIIGLFFSVASWLAIFTVIVPIVITIPTSLLLESIFTDLCADNSYFVIGPLILKTLWTLFLVTLVLYFSFAIFRLRRNKEIPKWTFICFLSLQLLIVHPLGFYIDTSQDWGRASDGQFILGIIMTFPKSSFAFVIIGIFLDVLRNIIKHSSSDKLKVDGITPTTHNSK